MSSEQQHRLRSFELFTRTALAGSLVLLAVRATGPMAPFEVAALVLLIGLSGAGAWWVPRRGGIDAWSTALLGTVVALAVVAHATIPSSENAVDLLGVVVVFASLLLGPSTFLGFSSILVAAALLARAIRIHQGLAGPDPWVGFVNLTLGYGGFALALTTLDRQHREAGERLVAATRDAQLARDRALAAIEAKTRFLANMSHELRTPLNAIIGYAELLHEDVQDLGGDGAELLERIRDAGTGLLGHLDQILEGARREVQSGAHSQVLDIDPRTLAEPSNVPAAAKLWQPATPKATIAAGAICVASALVMAVTGASAGIEGWASNVSLVVALGIVVGGLGMAGRAIAGHLVLIGGGVLLLTFAHATVVEAADLAAYTFCLFTVAALVVPTRYLGAVLVWLTALVAAGHGIRALSGWSTPLRAVVQSLAVGLVATAILAVVHRRQTHRQLLAGSATGAERAMRTARAAEAARDRFLEQMSHDVRTPLATIAGYAEFLAEDLPTELQADLQRIRSASAHLTGVVDDLIDMAHIQMGTLDPYVEDIDLCDLCREAIDLAQPLLQGSTLSTSLPGGPCVVRADRRRTRQILANLLTNAGKYARGPIELAVVTSPDDPVQVVVRDEGPGIPAEHLQRIFVPFDRLEAPTDVAGSGLGLAISRHLATSQGGDLQVESTVGEGSTFRLTLPRPPPADLAGPE